MPEDLDRRGLWIVSGLMLAGYGVLVLLGVLAHEATVVGFGLLAAGLLLLWRYRPALPKTKAARRDAGRRSGPVAEPAGPGRFWATFGMGLVSAGGVLAYNVAVGSEFTLPELAILFYGGALLAAASQLDRGLGPVDVQQVVAWSLPLVAAPLGVYALDAALDAGVGNSPLDLFIRHVLVPPMTATLDVLGFDVANHGQTVELGTPRGRLFLTVGLVCAGLQPGVLFLGVLGLHAWRERPPPGRGALLLGLGALAVYVMNLVRLVVLALVGHRWGGRALQTVHAHAGWVLFLALVVAFWGLVLPRVGYGDADVEAA